MTALTVGSAFGGIGGFDLAAERAGLTVAWQIECDPAARRVLARHWPTVPCYADVQEVTADHHAWHRHHRPVPLEGGALKELSPVDVITGGFP